MYESAFKRMCLCLSIQKRKLESVCWNTWSSEGLRDLCCALRRSESPVEKPIYCKCHTSRQSHKYGENLSLLASLSSEIQSGWQSSSWNVSLFWLCFFWIKPRKAWDQIRKRLEFDESDCCFSVVHFPIPPPPEMCSISSWKKRRNWQM